jgi:hypothetical protein
VYLTGLTLSLVVINSTDVGHVIIEKCSLADKKQQRNMRFKCKTVRALRLLRCSGMRKFTLHVSCVENLAIDSCSNLRDLDVSASKLHRIRICNCPFLEPINQIVQLNHA